MTIRGMNEPRPMPDPEAAAAVGPGVGELRAEVHEGGHGAEGERQDPHEGVEQVEAHALRGLGGGLGLASGGLHGLRDLGVGHAQGTGYGVELGESNPVRTVLPGRNRTLTLSKPISERTLRQLHRLSACDQDGSEGRAFFHVGSYHDAWYRPSRLGAT